MSEEQTVEAVNKLVSDALSESADGEAKRLERELHALEDKYGFDSLCLLHKLSSGEVKETDEIADWLWLLNLRGRSRLSQPV